MCTLLVAGINIVPTTGVGTHVATIDEVTAHQELAVAPQRIEIAAGALLSATFR